MAGKFNPFKTFRKYQKVGLATVGIMAMLSFIVLPPLMMSWRDSSQQKPQLIASCRRYGDVDPYRLHALRENRGHLRNFYNHLFEQIMPLAGENYLQLEGLYRLRFKYDSMYSEEELITEWLVARYAEEKGFSVDKKLIVDHLNSITGGLISTPLLNSVCMQIGLSDAHLSHLLQEELLAAYMFRMFEVSLASESPASRWEYYQRVRRSLTAEVAAVPVDSFVAEVPNPSEQELVAFFDKNKANVYDPSLPDSGFAVPTKIAFQMVDGTPSEELLASISQEEIEKFYEENKTKYFLRTLPQSDPGATGMPQRGLPGLPGLDRSFPGLGTLPGADLPGLNESAVFPGLGLGTPADAPPLEPIPIETEPVPSAEPQPKTPASPETPPAESTPPAAEPQSRTVHTPVYQNVVFQQESTEPAESTPPTEKTEAATTATEAPAAEIPAPEIPAATVPETAAPAAVTPATTVPETAAPVATATEAPAEAKPVDTSILYQPLSEVENIIRRMIAYQKVEDALKSIETEMRDYFTAYSLTDSDDPAALPKPLDLNQLAAQYHLKCITAATPISFFETQDKDYWRENSARSFLLRIFSASPANFDVLRGDQERAAMQPVPGMLNYLGWVTNKESQRTPEFNEPGMHELVLNRWREVQAREKARQKAKELAEEANRSQDKSLREVFEGKNIPVVETDRFSWFTQSLARTGYARSELRFGEVREQGVAPGDADFANTLIKAPGQEFMETAYSLSVGESGVAINQPQTTVYVIRLKETAPSEELLWRFFVNAPLNDYAGAGMMEDRQELVRAWLEQIESRVGFKWINRPQAPEMRGQDPGGF